MKRTLILAIMAVITFLSQPLAAAPIICSTDQPFIQEGYNQDARIVTSVEKGKTYAFGVNIQNKGTSGNYTVTVYFFGNASGSYSRTWSAGSGEQWSPYVEVTIPNSWGYGDASFSVSVSPSSCNSSCVCTRSKSFQISGGCTYHDHKTCYQDDVYWADCNGQVNDLYQDCNGGKVCQNASCVCSSHQSKSCSNGDLYWYDSCGNREGIAQDCQDLGCSNGACNTCTSHDHKSCSDGDLYWYDSCGVREGIAQDCEDHGCSNNACIICTSHDHKECSDGDLYWYDSCGNREEKAEECGGTVCVSNSRVAGRSASAESSCGGCIEGEKQYICLDKYNAIQERVCQNGVFVDGSLTYCDSYPPLDQQYFFCEPSTTIPGLTDLVTFYNTNTYSCQNGVSTCISKQTTVKRKVLVCGSGYDIFADKPACHTEEVDGEKRGGCNFIVLTPMEYRLKSKGVYEQIDPMGWLAVNTLFIGIEMVGINMGSVLGAIGPVAEGGVQTLGNLSKGGLKFLNNLFKGSEVIEVAAKNSDEAYQVVGRLLSRAEGILAQISNKTPEVEGLISGSRNSIGSAQEALANGDINAAIKYGKEAVIKAYDALATSLQGAPPASVGRIAMEQAPSGMVNIDINRSTGEGIMTFPGYKELGQVPLSCSGTNNPSGIADCRDSEGTLLKVSLVAPSGCLYARGAVAFGSTGPDADSARLILRAIVGLEDISSDRICAIPSGNLVPTADDARWILRKAVGLE